MASHYTLKKINKNQHIEKTVKNRSGLSYTRKVNIDFSKLWNLPGTRLNISQSLNVTLSKEGIDILVRNILYRRNCVKWKVVLSDATFFARCLDVTISWQQGQKNSSFSWPKFLFILWQLLQRKGWVRFHMIPQAIRDKHCCCFFLFLCQLLTQKMSPNSIHINLFIYLQRYTQYIYTSTFI